MSYNLYFWRQERNLGETPAEICGRLTDNAAVAGVAVLPRAMVRQKFRESFPDISDSDANLDWEGAGSYFQVGYNHVDENNVNCIIITCGYKLLDSPDTMNLIIDVGNSLGCALYDPQAGMRYAQPEGSTFGTPTKGILQM